MSGPLLAIQSKLSMIENKARADNRNSKMDQYHEEAIELEDEMNRGPNRFAAARWATFWATSRRRKDGELGTHPCESSSCDKSSSGNGEP